MQKQSPRGVLLEGGRGVLPEEGRGVLQMCCGCPGACLWMGVILIKLQSSFVEIALLRWCSPVGLLHVWGASSLENTSGGLLLNGDNCVYNFNLFFLIKYTFEDFKISALL